MYALCLCGLCLTAIDTLQQDARSLLDTDFDALGPCLLAKLLLEPTAGSNEELSTAAAVPSDAEQRALIKHCGMGPSTVSIGSVAAHSHDDANCGGSQFPVILEPAPRERSNCQPRPYETVLRTRTGTSMEYPYGVYPCLSAHTEADSSST